MPEIYPFSQLGSTQVGIGLGFSLLKEIDLYLPYKYNEPHRAAARLCHGQHAWNLMYLEKRLIPHTVWIPFLHGPELEWPGQKPE